MTIFERLISAGQARKRSAIMLAFLCLVFGGIAFIPQGFAQAGAPPAPTLLAPQGVVATDHRIEVTGLTWDGTTVAIYLDGVFHGYATVYEQDPSQTAHFNYWLPEGLAPGLHVVGSHAEFSEQGIWGSDAKVLSFWVPFPVPVPTLYTPVVNAETRASQPWITGHAANDSRISVYLDGRKDQTFPIQNDASGTAFFKVKPTTALTSGSHAVHVVAENVHGLDSEPSAQVTFAVATTGNITSSGASTESTASNEQVLGVETSEEAKETVPDSPLSSEETEAEDADTIDEEVTSTPEAGETNESTVNEETANENVNEEEDNGNRDSGTALWLVVIAVIVILIIIRLTGGGAASSGMGGAMKKFFTEEGLRGQEKKDTGTGQTEQQPPPPPNPPPPNPPPPNPPPPPPSSNY
jgi:hypothetical protein